MRGLNNLRNVRGGLDFFASDFDGEYPNDSTAEQLAELSRDDEPSRPNNRKLDGGRKLESSRRLSKREQKEEIRYTANDYLEQVIGNGLDNEDMLYHNAFRSTFEIKKSNSDGKVDKGENVWGYTRNLHRISSGHIPVVYDSPVSTGESPRFSQKTWDGRILVARMNGATEAVPIAGSDAKEGVVRQTIRGESINLFSQEALEEGQLVPANLNRIGRN